MAVEVADMQSAGDLDGAFAAMISKRVGAVLVVVGPLTYLLKEPIAESAIRYRLPTISNANQCAEAGLLMSYGPKLEDLYRRAAIHVDKILHGASPADLPVEQPSRFELTINLKTSKALALTIPQSLLMRAEEVIQRWIVTASASARTASIARRSERSISILRRAAIHVDKILRGAKPGDLPIEQPTTFELVINLKAAKALGLTVPQSLLLRADEVIE